MFLYSIRCDVKYKRKRNVLFVLVCILKHISKKSANVHTKYLRDEQNIIYHTKSSLYTEQLFSIKLCAQKYCCRTRSLLLEQNRNCLTNTSAKVLNKMI